MKEILNTGVVSANFNGHYKQEVIFENEKGSKFRIVINRTEHKSVLYKWSDTEGWLYVLERHTKNHYGIDVAYKSSDRVPQNVYEPVIKDMKELSTNF